MNRKFHNLVEIAEHIQTLQNAGCWTLSAYQEIAPLAVRLSRALPEELQGDALAFLSFAVRPEWPQLAAIAA